MIPALGKQKQMELCKFKASLVYRTSFKTAKAKQQNPVLENQIVIMIKITRINFKRLGTKGCT